ncbi:MAG: hypothetical protein WC655_27410 [Candidatus Hydrogenedentales bacterium]|jgi:hypothetical protein
MAIQDANCLRLEAHPPENMLFGRLLKNQELPTTPTLFRESNDAMNRQEMEQ